MQDLTILVGTVGQSVMRSEDSGQTWARIGPRRGFPYEASVRCLAVHPREANIIFAGTERGLYRSDDAGACWRSIDSALNGHYLWALAIDPVNPDVMFAGTGTPTPAAMFRSTDGGQSWQLLPLPVAPNSTVWTFGTNPADPNIIFAASRYGYLYRSDSCGESWMKLNRELSEIAAVRWLPNLT